MSQSNDTYADVLAKMTCVVEDNLHRGFEHQAQEKQAGALTGTAVGAGLGGVGTYLFQDMLSKYYKTKDPTIKHALLGALLGGGVGAFAGDRLANPTLPDLEDTPTEHGTYGDVEERYNTVRDKGMNINPIGGAGLGAGLEGLRNLRWGNKEYSRLKRLGRGGARGSLAGLALSALFNVAS